MKYAIVANPKAGNKKREDRKKEILNQAARYLGASIFGLESNHKTEFQEIVRSVSNDCEILIVAGGDGTFSDVLNAQINPQVILAYLPLGSGNALRHGLHLPGSFKKWCELVLHRQCHDVDVILYNNTYRCFFSGIGFESHIMQERKRMQQRGFEGFLAYGLPIVKGLITRHPRFNATIDVDGKQNQVSQILTISLGKYPYYGYGINANPYAKWDDGFIHLRAITESNAAVAWRLPYSFISSLAPQTYLKGKSITITTEQPQPVQCDGEYFGTSVSTSFTILPKNIKLIW